MKDIHEMCLAVAKQYDQPRNHMAGANIVGFLKVTRAMQKQGVILYRKSTNERYP